MEKSEHRQIPFLLEHDELNKMSIIIIISISIKCQLSILFEFHLLRILVRIGPQYPLVVKQAEVTKWGDSSNETAKT